MADSYGCHKSLEVGGKTYTIASLSALAERGFDLSHLPYALKILLENLLRREDGEVVSADDVAAIANWDPAAEPSREIAYMPARVLLQDFTGVPAVVDFAAMRDALASFGDDPKKINPLQPAELVIDHSVQVDSFGTAGAFQQNADLEYERNAERYAFLKWGQSAFDNFRVVPPETGICHQVNLEYLARGVMTANGWAYPDTLVGTDSHTTMINGLGVLGWGVGGIEAEAAMLGQPVSMLIPQVVGFRMTGRLAEGVTATDLVLTVTQMLRAHGVVGKFVEFFGPGARSLGLADRATISNMSPEYGATCGIFPIDDETLRYLRFTGRSETQVQLVEAYTKAQGLFAVAGAPEANYSSTLELDLGTVDSSLAGPKRPQDRVALSDLGSSFGETLAGFGKSADESVHIANGTSYDLHHGDVVIASITSCTNTSNPSVLIAAGLVAKKAVERGLQVKPWVKTSLAPGSQVVTDYLDKAGLTGPLDALGFNLVGYGCTTCIGNSGPLPAPVAKAVDEGDLVVASVLSGNRNFEGRVHQQVRANYLASPPLVVAFALAGKVGIDLRSEPLGTGSDGQPVYLKDIWPTNREVADALGGALQAEMFASRYQDVFAGDEHWQSIEVPAGDTYAWDDASTYVKLPPYFIDMPENPPAAEDLSGARVLAMLGDSVTTDHISPAGSITATGPAGRYLMDLGVDPKDFNSYGSRRGNHEVMMRGTFANIRLRNKLVPGVEGGETRHLPDGEPMSIYDAAMQYADEGVPLLVIAGKEYGSGSSRDWAAKGPRLQGVRVVIAESYERIHRSNLIGMGVAPLQFQEGDNAESLGLTGEEVYAFEGLAQAVESRLQAGRTIKVTATADDGSAKTFDALLRIDTPQETDYYRHGGILHYVLRQLRG